MDFLLSKAFLIEVIKWGSLFSIVVLAFIHYRREFKTINQVRRVITRPELIPKLAAEARSRMLMFLLVFFVFTIWIFAYELKVKNVTGEKIQAVKKLEVTEKRYSELVEENNRSFAEKITSEEVLFYAEDIRTTYTDAFVLFYLMRKCEISEQSDVFIINSAMMRELRLNSIPLSVRNNIIFDAKLKYKELYIDYDCTLGNDDARRTAIDYVNFIDSARVSLQATF